MKLSPFLSSLSPYHGMCGLQSLRTEEEPSSEAYQPGVIVIDLSSDTELPRPDDVTAEPRGPRSPTTRPPPTERKTHTWSDSMVSRSARSGEDHHGDDGDVEDDGDDDESSDAESPMFEKGRHIMV